ncbi:hypothetical protein AB0F90_10575 [Micromonospora chalcea]|uniref:hypothetical protein n=1 Tax=Micromonospora chalcea TaxID=1874 RepID=UPI00340DC557
MLSRLLSTPPCLEQLDGQPMSISSGVVQGLAAFPIDDVEPRTSDQQQDGHLHVERPTSLEGTITLYIHGMMQQSHAVLVRVLDVGSIVQELPQPG